MSEANSLRGLLAPAKINLFLHVTGLRSDGYHLLQSVFVMIDWCDELHFERRVGDSRLTREDLTVPLPQDDLTLRAARALQLASGTHDGVHIQVAKHIPSQAGLGGGSSDAALVLLALNELWQLNWPLQRLLALGEKLGADVPFFLLGQSAWVEGVGEQLTPLAGATAVPGARFVVLKPQAGVSTPDIFRHPDLPRSTPRATIESFCAAPFAFGRNDLQVAAQSLCPELQTAVAWLAGRGFQARMTGSGSAVFAVVPDFFSRERIGLMLEQVPVGWIGRECASLNAHPARACLAQAGLKSF